MEEAGDSSRNGAKTGAKTGANTWGNAMSVIAGVTPEIFAEVVAQGQPAVFKGAVADWPLVQQALVSNEAVGDGLKGLDSGRPAQVWVGDPAIRGEFFYGNSLDELNFRKIQVPLSVSIDHLLALENDDNPQAVFIQSLSIADHLPGFLRDHSLSLLPSDVMPRIWIGNRLRVQTHYDPVDNVACLVAGRRRFTLFAPDQLPNLYIGPLYKTIAGAPISMASLENPDFERFPRLRDAMDNAWIADLEPGDAIYIPYFWWHHVQSQTPFNILVNYWWDQAPGEHAEANDAFMHALLTIKQLSSGKRDIWKTMFDHYVFESFGDPAAHLGDADKGVLGAMPEAEIARMKQGLLARLMGRWGTR